MIYLTGAGPGDLELLTLKALKAIQNADVISRGYENIVEKIETLGGKITKNI